MKAYLSLFLCLYSSSRSSRLPRCQSSWFSLLCLSRSLSSIRLRVRRGLSSEDCCGHLHAQSGRLLLLYTIPPSRCGPPCCPPLLASALAPTIKAKHGHREKGLLLSFPAGSPVEHCFPVRIFYTFNAKQQYPHGSHALHTRTLVAIPCFPQQYSFFSLSTESSLLPSCLA